MRLADSVDAERKSIYRSLQNGLRFKTLCGHCNNHLLGATYDRELNALSGFVSAVILGSELALPPVLSFECKPQYVARAVVGHLLATDVRDDMNSPPHQSKLGDAMRSYFLDVCADLPTELRLFMWPSDLDGVVILRNCGPQRFSYPHDVVVADFLKYNPLSFMLAHGAPRTVRDGRHLIEVPVRGVGFDQSVKLVIPTAVSRRVPASWPEAPIGMEAFLFHGGSCYVARVDDKAA